MEYDLFYFLYFKNSGKINVGFYFFKFIYVD